jgi:hypothetical protein
MSGVRGHGDGACHLHKHVRVRGSDLTGDSKLTRWLRAGTQLQAVAILTRGSHEPYQWHVL